MLNINFWNIAFTIINIVVLYLFLKHFLMKPLMSILEERKQMVEKELDKAAAANRDAGLLKKKYEVSHEKADEEAGRIVAQAKERAGEEYEKILSKADADASKKLEDAKKMIDLEREKALNDLRASVTGLAMTATTKLLSEQAGPESDKKRYQAFLASAGEKHD